MSTTWRTRPYVWDRGRPTSDPGVLITGTYGRETFVSHVHMREIADALHNAADRHEQENTNAETASR